MIKKIVLRILPFALAASLAVPVTASAFELIHTGTQGEVVLCIQNRLIDLSYLYFKPTGSFGGMTRAGTINFQDVNGIMADGTIGEESLAMLFSNTTKRSPIPASVKIPIGPTSKDPFTKTGKQGDWASEIDSALKKGGTYTITDLNTNTTFSMIRKGGTNHADMEPASNDDAAKFLSVFGGAVNWSKRPVLVTIDGTDYAASLSGMPHGADTISGDEVVGAVCLYFSNSKSDVSNLADEEHRVTVLKAAGIE